MGWNDHIDDSTARDRQFTAVTKAKNEAYEDYRDARDNNASKEEIDRLWNIYSRLLDKWYDL